MPYTGRLETTPLLDIIQIVAYSQQSGLLSVKGVETKGLLIFRDGNIVCAYSPSALPLLVKAAKEQEEGSRLSLRRLESVTQCGAIWGYPDASAAPGLRASGKRGSPKAVY